MRVVYFLFLALFTAAVAAFAYYNQDAVTLKFWEYSLTTSLAVLAGVAYLLGMVSGWTLLKVLRRSATSVLTTVDEQMHRSRASG